MRGQMKCPQCNTTLKEKGITMKIDKKKTKIQHGLVPDDIVIKVTSIYQCEVDNTEVDIPETFEYARSG